MPRIYDVENCPLDFCRSCWPKGRDETIDEMAEEGITRGYIEGDSHPDYEGSDYDCFRCGSLLTQKDD